MSLYNRIFSLTSRETERTPTFSHKVVRILFVNTSLCSWIHHRTALACEGTKLRLQCWARSECACLSCGAYITPPPYLIGSRFPSRIFSQEGIHESSHHLRILPGVSQTNNRDDLQPRVNQIADRVVSRLI